MHTFSESATGVPAFLAKLWRLVEDPDTNELIYWQSDGRSFIIQNQAQFARELLPLNYKHNNMASFIRQLNMYGFHKMASIDNGGLKFDKDEMEFSHVYFQRDNPYLLEHIKRKIATTKQVPEDKAAIKPEIVNKVMNDVRTVRSRQDVLDSQFSSMKLENESLWREVAVLRQKHIKQQQIVNKLIQFLVTLVQPTRGGAGINSMNGVKRGYQLMINDVPDSAKKRKKSEKGGPVIHELTEDLMDECDYEYETPTNSPNVPSPVASVTPQDAEVDENSSSANFSVEQVSGVADNDVNDKTSSYDPNGKVSYIIDNLPDDYDWVNSQTMPDKVKLKSKNEPVQEYVISYVNPPTKDKSKIATKIVTKPVIASKVQSPPGTSLLNSQKLTKKRPQLALKMNKQIGKPIGRDAKVIPSAVIGPAKVVVTKKPTTATSVKKPSKDVQKNPSKLYTNQRDFDDSEMPSDLFDSQDDTESPMLSSGANVVYSSFDSTIPAGYPKKVIPTSSKQLALEKYNNNKQDGGDMQLNTQEDVNKQLENIQGDLESLKDLFQADNDYLLDPNAFFSNPSGSTSPKNRLMLSPSVDSELFAKLFGELEAPFGMPMNSDFPIEKRDDAGTSGYELINYQPYNSLDLSEIMGPDSTLADVGDQQKEDADDDLEAPELNTPRPDKRTILFNTK